MAEERRCATCAYWDEDESAFEDFGACRRFPPTANEIRRDHSGDVDVVIGHFAETTADDWCGEHRSA